ncbi:MAG: hypothetical protein AABZ30_08585 [Myxococcota bacterium]|mgnify:CR=1 FL=1
MPQIDKPDRARQLARAIASDLAVYHEDKIKRGLEADNLFDAIKEEIEEGRALFRERVTPEIFELHQFDRALVDVLVKSQAHVRCKAW